MKMMFKSKHVLIMLILLRYTVAREVKINTLLGPVLGEIVFVKNRLLPMRNNSHDRIVYVFKGIPYAEPLSNETRFQAPKEKVPWSPGMVHARKFGKSCPQNDIYLDNLDETSENCLFLNIYAPKIANTTHGGLPVMVNIHGGSFAHGDSKKYDASFLTLQGRVIIVTFNYRLGPLGFFSTGDAASPGNYGLLDQRLAIKWVFNNIAFFGGNANKITLFGHEAGAVSVGLHMLSPVSNELFDRGILQSGSEIAPGAVRSDKAQILKSAIDFAKSVSCDQIDYENNETLAQQIVDCLKSKSIEQLVNTKFDPNTTMFAWNPVLDVQGIARENEFLRELPIVIMQDESYFSKPFMSGLGTDLGENILVWDKSISKSNFADPNDFSRYLKNLAEFKNLRLEPFCESVICSPENIISFAYQSQYKSPKYRLLDMLTDAYYIAPLARSLNIREENGQGEVFQYVLAFENSQGANKHRRRLFSSDFYEKQSEELDYIFGLPITHNNSKWTADDKKISINMINLWCQFAYSNLTNSDTIRDYGSVKRYIEIGKTLKMSEKYAPKSDFMWNVMLKDGDPNAITDQSESAPTMEELNSQILALKIWAVVLGLIACMCFIMFIFTMAYYRRFWAQYRSHFWG